MHQFQQFELEIFKKLGDSGINKVKLQDLKNVILELTKGRQATVQDVISKADVSPKFLTYCLKVGVLQDFNYDPAREVFSRKLRLVVNNG